MSLTVILNLPSIGAATPRGLLPLYTSLALLSALEPQQQKQTRLIKHAETSSCLIPSKFLCHLKSPKKQRLKLPACNHFALRCMEPNCQWISTGCQGRGRDLTFLSDHALLLTDGNQPTPDQTMLHSDHSHCGVSGGRKRRVMTTAYKYDRLLSYLGWDESAQDSGSVNCELMIKKQTADLSLFNFSSSENVIFSHVIVGMAQHHLVFLTLLLCGEPSGTTWGGFISLILITLITAHWLRAKNSEWPCIFYSQNSGTEIMFNKIQSVIKLDTPFVTKCLSPDPATVIRCMPFNNS